MNCALSCCKYCSDKIIHALNCVIGIPNIAVIVAKSYDIYGLKDVGWGIIIAPIAILVFLNIIYIAMCYKMKRCCTDSDDYGSVA